METEDIGQTSQDLQTGYLTYVTLLNNAAGQTPPARSVGVLRLTNVKPGMPFATCGATWVSKHHAVTAAHCVSHLSLNSTFNVEEVSLGSLDSTQLSSYATVSGTWPNWHNGANLTTGYNLTTYTGCRVTRRCGDGGSQEGPSEWCPISGSADLAMVRCMSRTNTNYAQTTSALSALGMPPNQDDIGDLNVNIYWFHELYGLPVSDDGTQRWRHYGFYDANDPGNEWHYQRYHQVLPFRSWRWPNGTNYRTVKPASTGTENAIDVPVCHGTSGSGVFVLNTNILLGPAIAGGPDGNADNQLCDNPIGGTPGTRRTLYIRGTITNSFVNNSPEVVTADR